MMSESNHTSNYSYWELKHYFKKYDLIIIGSGIVGLSTAISFKKKNKKAKVLVLEKGFLPEGASTKNAGFACFGSITELNDDLKKMPESVVWETVQMRWQGLQLLRKRFGDKALGFHLLGGFEIFENQTDFQLASAEIETFNYKIQQVLAVKNCYQHVSLKSMKINSPFPSVKNSYEGQLDTALLMEALLNLVYHLGIEVLNNVHIKKLSEFSNGVELEANRGLFTADKVVIATNGFASELVQINDVKPARAQVLITKPIKGLKVKGTFHFNSGFYYFRNIDDRILFGGGRNMDLKGETTTRLQVNKTIQNQLDRYLSEMILPNQAFEVDHRWTGIMGLGSEKKPIIQKIGNRVLVAVRMGGMGIAIGSIVGEIAANKIS